MSKPARRDDDETSFEDVLDLGSVPPPPMTTNVHAAPTAVANLPPELLDELRRVKRDALDLARTRRLERFEPPHGFGSEAPTAPGKDSQSLLRPLAPDLADIPAPAPTDDLVAALTAALAEAEEIGRETLDAPILAPEPPPPATTYGTAPIREPEIVEVAPVEIAPPETPLPPLPRTRHERAEVFVAAAVVIAAFALAAARIFLHFHR